MGADARPEHSASCVLLVALNGAAALVAALWLLDADILPIAMAMHGAMMIVAWGCLLPLGGLVARYFKITPHQNFPAVVDNPFWWNFHRIVQYTGAALATGAVATVLWQTSGRIQTIHGRCGVLVMILTWLQLASPLFRGSKGGPTDTHADAGQASTWRGDHFDMTRRRRLFEAWHKTVGWSLIVLAQATIVLGVDLIGAPVWLLSLVATMVVALVLALLDSRLRGRWVDTHTALWGPAAWGDRFRE